MSLRVKASGGVAFWMICLLCFISAEIGADPASCPDLGKKRFDEGNYEEAVSVLQKCSDDPEAWAPLGRSYFELNRLEEAKTFFAKASCSAYVR